MPLGVTGPVLDDMATGRRVSGGVATSVNRLIAVTVLVRHVMLVRVPSAVVRHVIVRCRQTGTANRGALLRSTPRRPVYRGDSPRPLRLYQDHQFCQRRRDAIAIHRALAGADRGGPCNIALHAHRHWTSLALARL